MLYIVFDTNLLDIAYDRGHTDFFSFGMNRNYYDAQTIANHPSRSQDCIVCIPEVVISELLHHREEAYRNSIDRVKSTLDGFGENGHCEFDISPDQYHEENIRQAQAFFSHEKIEQIENCCNEYFPIIINDSIMKQPPFEGKDGKADKGFKDTVIWYSIIQFAKQHPGEYIFITNDDIFHRPEKANFLKERFLSLTNCSIQFFRTVKEIKPVVVQHSAQKYINDVKILEVQKAWEFTSEDERCVAVSWIYPKIIGEDGSIVYINSQIESIYQSVYEKWKQEYNDRKVSIDRPLHFVDDLKYRVLYNQDGKLCIRFERYAYYEEGVHGTHYWIVKVFDLNTGNELKMKDLLTTIKGDLLSYVKLRFEEDKLQHPDKYWKDFSLSKYTCLEDFKFYYDETGLYIFFDPYEANCYASGFVTLKIFPM